MSNMFIFTKRERERLSFSLIWLVVLLMFALTCVETVSGEGSREFNADDNSVRSYLQSYTNSVGSLYEQPHYVYMRAGEKMYLGTSVYQRDDFEITVTDTFDVINSYNVVQNGNGYIGTRAQELAGPKPVNLSGYSPITYTATEDGLYKVNFYGVPGGVYAQQVINAQDWNISGNPANIAAWDITVVDQNDRKINGRTFVDSLSFHAVDWNYNPYLSSFYVYILTENGYQYKVTVDNFQGGGYTISSSNMGIMVNGHSAYTSSGMNARGYSYFYRNNFIRQSNGGIMNRLFYNKPDSALLNYLGLPADGSPIIPSVSNLQFTSTSNANNSVYVNEGGTFTFDSTGNSEKYILTLNFDNGNEVKKYGTTSSRNSVTWDGTDANGNSVEAGTFTAKLELLPGESHFILDDLESITNGIVVQKLNGNSTNPYQIYYDHTPQSVDGFDNQMNMIGQEPQREVNYATLENWIVDADNPSIKLVSSPLNGKDGVNSSSGASKMPAPWSNDNPYTWSDYKRLDFWTYDDSILPLNINVNVVSDEKINILVNKLWEDDSNRDGVRPSTISIKLLQNEIEYNTAAITGSASNTWTYTFRNLPKYNTDGQLFEYSVEEVVE